MDNLLVIIILFAKGTVFERVVRVQKGLNYIGVGGQAKDETTATQC